MSDRTEVWSQIQKSPVVFSVVYDSFERDTDVSLLLRILSGSELRAFRAVPDPDRAFQFLWGRALFFYVTRALLGIDDAHLDIDPGGRPYVVHDGSRGCLDVNLSHCRGHVVMAMSATEKVGIDVELDRRAATDVAERFFSRSEVAWMMHLDPRARDHASVRLWTIKEACAKATGEGLKPPLVSVEVPPRSCGRSSRGTWWGIEVGDGVTCSIAVDTSRDPDHARPWHVRLDRSHVATGCSLTFKNRATSDRF